jgi:hypothetical protein
MIEACIFLALGKDASLHREKSHRCSKQPEF